MRYGLSNTGFTVKPYSQIQSELQASFQAVFGNELDVSPQSNFGQEINNMSQQLSTMWELLQAIYSGFNPDSASGAQLDDACARVNVKRLAATPSVAVVMLYGTIGTVIPSGHTIAQTGTLLQLTLNSGITIQQSASGDITLAVKTVLNNQIYTITVNGTPYTYTSSGSATAAAIIAGLTSALGAISNITITNPTATTLRLFATDGMTAFNCQIDSNLQVNTLGTPGNYNASVSGAVSFPANTLTKIVNAISGLATVNNLIPATIGVNLESDNALRVRRLLALKSIGRGTDGAIAQNIIQNVTGVTAAIVYSNRSDVTDSYGRPPHSFEAVVSGGAAAAVALMIWQTMPSGINTYGNTSATVTDSNGGTHLINFSRPVNVYVWLTVSLLFYSKESYPVSGDAAVAAAIVSWAASEFQSGVDVILQRVLSPIYTVPGISQATLTIAITTNITAPGSQAATLSIANPCVVTSANHGLLTGFPVQFATTGALPSPIVAGTTYYAIYVSANQYNLATTYANAIAGVAISTFGGSQSGSQSMSIPYLTTEDTPISSEQIAVISAAQISVTP